ncbi:fungal-specific transcription factor domain-containing protein [Scleroderma yunnanense]
MSHQSSDSPSSDVASSNTSPAQLITALTSRPSDDTDEQTPRLHDTPSRIPIDLPRPASTGKGGCWTCRLRRKKCDEQREGDSCHTCNRLKIKCLGWGPKRPDWMRDKQAVETYKADIKAQLTRAGLIRGQPRSSILQATTGSSSVFTTHQYQGPSSTVLPIANEPGPTPSLIFSDPSHGQNLGEGSSGSVNSPFDFQPQYDTNFSQINTHSPYTPSITIPPSHPSPHDLAQFTPTFDNFTPSPVTFNGETTITALSGHNIQTEHVLYYFSRVCGLQFALPNTSVEDITYSLVLQYPQGSLTNALCALASLHDVCLRTSKELVPNMLENSQALVFYDNACAQLHQGRQSTLSEADANAALHLLSFSTFSGGVTDWQPMLDIANEWVMHTGITSHENPKLAIINMSPGARLALRTTMWLDVMSTVTLCVVPKHLHFYRRLYRGGGGFWAASGRNAVEELDTRVESLTGCPDEALLGIAEISSLECWKSQEFRNGTLSMKELIRRGDVLERHLRADNQSGYSQDVDQTRLHPESAMSDTSTTRHSGATSQVDVTRQVVASIFREAAIMYLHIVLSGANPGVPEIMRSVEIIIIFLRQLPVSIVDRVLIFPIYLVGCMTDNPVQREVLKTRLLNMQDGFGNIHQTVRVLETVWHRRDNRGGVVEWRDLLHVQGRHRLLLV